MANKRHTIVRLDKVKSSGTLESVWLEEDQDCGIVVQLDKGIATDGEARKGIAPKDLKANLIFMAPVPMNYVNSLAEEDFYMEAKKLYRGYVLSEGDIVTLTNEAFDAKPNDGDIIVPKTSSFGYAVGDKESSLKFEVIRSEFLAGYPATVLRVL